MSDDSLKYYLANNEPLAVFRQAPAIGTSSTFLLIALVFFTHLSGNGLPVLKRSLIDVAFPQSTISLKENAMKHVLILTAGLFIVSNLVGCQPASESKPAAAEDDGKKVEGTWVLVGGEKDGEPLSEEEIKNSKLTIVGDAYTVELGDGTVKKGTQKLDASKTPKQIDAEDTSGPTTGQNLGIYEFTPTGDFRVSFGATGAERPTEFTTKAGSGNFIHVWQRAKAE